ADRIEVADGARDVAERERVHGAVDLGVRDDLRIAELVRERRRTLVEVAGAGVATGLREAPAERGQEAAFPGAIGDPVADLVRLRQLGDRATVVREAARGLPEEPARPDDEVREAEPPSGGDRLLADRDRAPVVARPLGDLREIEARRRDRRLV